MIVTSAAVPAVVGKAIIGTDVVLVLATPSSETTFENSGLLVIIPIAFAVSVGEPPPMAMMKSAADAAYAFTPAFTFVTVGVLFYFCKSGVGDSRLFQYVGNLFYYSKFYKIIVCYDKCFFKVSPFYFFRDNTP